MQALIVAGPSGVGKSTFLKGLYSGRLASDLRSLLPSDVHRWPMAHCSAPHQWQWAVSGPPGPGIVIHHDITHSWRTHGQEPGRAPFWQILHRCDRVTLVVLQLPPRRLLVQWSLDRLGMHPWKVRPRRLLAILAWRVLRGVRLLRRSRRPDQPSQTRYPRRLRFLKRVDRKLRSLRMLPTQHFDFYRRPANVERMMASWSNMVETKTGSLPVTRIEMEPVLRVAADTGPTWRVSSIKRMREPVAAQLAPVPA